MESIQLITFVVWLILIIIFIRISINIARVKEELIRLREDDKKAVRQGHNLSYQTNRVLGNNAEALNSMVAILMHDLTTEPMTKTELRAKYEDFKIKNESKFEKLGGVFPEYPFSE